MMSKILVVCGLLYLLCALLNGLGSGSTGITVAALFLGFWLISKAG